MKKQSSYSLFPHNLSSRIVLPVLSFLLLISLVINGIFVYQSLERMRVIAVPDGDSLQLKDGRRVRLLGIDAPERGRCMAGEARNKLVDLALGKRVRLKQIVTDDYGRMLANVIVEDVPTWLGFLRWKYSGTRPGLEATQTASDSGTKRDYSGTRPGLEARGFPDPDPLLQRALLSAGLARNRSSSGNPYNEVLKDAQEIAKSAKIGIWSDACRGQVPASEDCTIKGNTRAGEKYYYVPSCRQYSQVLVDRAYGDAWFCSETEAREAGFVPSPVCGK